MADDALFLPGLSPVAGKPVRLAFDGGRRTLNGGVLVLAEIEHKLQIAERLLAVWPIHGRRSECGMAWLR